ncbi:MAG: hypothetical protein M8861_04315 [marine benthic group bacterium]|nr:hypothetical protein [Gemmatimonadota bacterium]
MELWLIALVLTVIVTGGVWGSIVLSGLFKMRASKLAAPADDPRIGQLEEDHLRLEAQIARLEEEISFFRELRKPEIATQLPSPPNGESGPEA